MNDTKFIYGHLKDFKVSERLTQELRAKGIGAGFYEEGQGRFVLYVENETDFDQATDHLRVILGLPRRMEVSKEWQEIKKLPTGSLTFGILILLVIIFGVGDLLKERWVYDLLMFGPKSGDIFLFIKQGQLWRVFTPALIHFGFLHALFNLLWWKDLGSILEHTKGKGFLVFFLLLTGIISNIFQAIMDGANFGGLSGVVYGLLGYLWIYKLINKESRYGLPKQDVFLMLGWLVLGILDVFHFKMANWAHGMGLVSGMVIAALVGYWDNLKLRS